MTHVIEQKRQLRAVMRAQRRAFVTDLPASVRNLVFNIPPEPARTALAQAQCAGLHISEEFEAPTQRYIDFAHDSGTDIALPYFAARFSAMEFRSYKPGDPLEAGPLGPLQPHGNAAEARPDVLVMPLLAFDAGLQRLGQGGGHYDRYLAAHGSLRTIGLAWTVQEVQGIPCEPHDRPLDMVVTQASVIEKPCGKAA